MIPRADPLPSDFGASLARVGARLRPFGSRLLFFNTIGSTNDVACALAAASDAEGAVVVAEAQSSGRGRRGRSWYSPPGAGLYVSVVLAPAQARVSPERATALITLAAGVALADAVERITGLAPDIKWPNDLLVGKRKLAGILAEGVSAAAAPGLQAVVLGYGVNVGFTQPPPDLAARVTSLESELGRRIDRADLLAESLASLADRYRDLLDGRFDAILDAWRRRAPGSRGARVSWETPAGPRAGITAGIDDRGALLVSTGEGVERIVSGEVIWS